MVLFAFALHILTDVNPGARGRRNIVVFSANLSALTIEHDSEGIKKPSGPDLLISYHDNQHYNSVRINSLPKPPPPIKTFVRVTSEDAVEVEVDETDDSDGTASQAQSDGPGASGVTTEDDSSTDSLVDSTHAEADDDEYASRCGSSALGSTGSDSDVQLPPRVKKNANCPCGSGLRYKKCCLAKAKHAARVRRLRGPGSAASSSCSVADSRSEERDDDDREELQGGFRVLKI
jgi:SEC-C motif